MPTRTRLGGCSATAPHKLSRSLSDVDLLSSAAKMIVKVTIEADMPLFLGTMRDKVAMMGSS